MGAAEAAPRVRPSGGSAGRLQHLGILSPLESPGAGSPGSAPGPQASKAFSLPGDHRPPRPAPPPLPHLLPCPLSPSLPEHLFPRWRRKFTSEPISCVSRSEKQPPDPRYVDRDSRWRELALNKLPWCPHPRKRVQCLQERGQDEARELTRPSCLALLSLLTVRESDAAKGCAIKSSHRKGATLELNVSITSALNTSKQWRQGSVF